MDIDYKIVIDKSYDPYMIRNKLYKLTDLEKSVAINFNIIRDKYDIVKLSLRDLILSWIDERREYKRRLLNKKIVTMNARKSYLEILINVLNKDNMDKVIKIIKSHSLNECEHALVKEYGMNSHQALKIATMKLNMFNKDTRKNAINELEKLNESIKEIMELIKSEKKIDELIMSELDDLKKYASPRKSKVITDDDIIIPDTDHLIIITNRGFIKKLPYKKEQFDKSPGYGVFAQYDYPTQRVVINNYDSLLLFDDKGKYSCIPVYDIQNTPSSIPGNKIFDVSRLEGKIIATSPYISYMENDAIKNTAGDEVYLVTLSKNGMIKRTPVSEFNQKRHVKNSKIVKLKDDDSLVYADFVIGNNNVLIYTKKGRYVILSCNDIPVSGKFTIGNSAINLEDNDECVRFSLLGNRKIDYIVVLTEKGYMKKCEVEFLGTAMRRRKDSSYLIHLDGSDNLLFCDGISDTDRVIVCTRTSYSEFTSDIIPTMSRKAKARKMIPLVGNDNIISMIVSEN